jgi:hypothetical protein
LIRTLQITGCKDTITVPGEDAPRHWYAGQLLDTVNSGGPVGYLEP